MAGITPLVYVGQYQSARAEILAAPRV